MKLERSLLVVEDNSERDEICDLYGFDRQRLQSQIAMIHQMFLDEGGPESVLTVDSMTARFRNMSRETRCSAIAETPRCRVRYFFAKSRTLELGHNILRKI